MIGHRLFDRDGAGVGRIGQVFYDDQTDAPTWITVRTGLFGTSESFVPLRGARALGDGVQVPYDLETIRSAPSFDIDQHISVEQEDMIYHHYGLPPEPGVPAQRPAESRPRGRHRRPDPEEQGERQPG
ncbi:PRC-barrel domain containing protein [Nocardiopsis composta]|uniref:PRC-barrel domain-containing protein n=1 Tax=Nocardiopsis composta TaxID=157465 RepID=A0A7W8QNN3_9ACTN|nr:PRC-barrel domain containing protein [Nocardiopsis composta]MBB5433110.1 hypothetical protein [Nocardiopsis composta]HLU72969.1 PRC-barrel domain containing protein [Nonomuraea sp.]